MTIETTTTPTSSSRKKKIKYIILIKREIDSNVKNVNKVKK